MFDALLKRLTGSAPAPLPPEDARLALTALLVRIARSDGDYADVEIAQISRIVARRYELGESATTDLLWEAEALEEQAPDTVRFTRSIKDAVAYEDRLAVVTAAWKVVMADGKRMDEENALMRLIASLLGVKDSDSHAERRKVSD